MTQHVPVYRSIAWRFDQPRQPRYGSGVVAIAARQVWHWYSNHDDSRDVWPVCRKRWSPATCPV